MAATMSSRFSWRNPLELLTPCRGQPRPGAGVDFGLPTHLRTNSTLQPSVKT